jgi:AcrR family transcriptional regulator
MKKTDTKSMIFDAAIEIIAEKGVNEFSLNKVSQQAGISKGGLLYHFPTKDALLLGLHQHFIQFLRNLLDKKIQREETYTEAYIAASYAALYSKEIKAYTSLTNYEWDQQIESIWDDYFNEVHENLSRELSDEWITLIDLITEGIWTKGFYYSEKELDAAIEFLKQLIK